MIFAPFAFQNQIVTAAGFPSFTQPSNTVLYVNAAIASSYPGTGTEWYDIAGNTTGSLVNGPVYSSGPPALIDFDGTNDYCEFPYNATQSTFTSGLTLYNWVWFDGKANNATIIGKGNNDGAITPPYVQYVLNFHDPFTNGIRFNATINGSVQEIIMTDKAINTGQWYCICATYDGTTMKGYVNGSVSTQTGNFAGTMSTYNTVTGISRIKAFGSYGSNRMGMSLVANSAATATDITNFYNATKGYYGL